MASADLITSRTGTGATVVGSYSPMMTLRGRTKMAHLLYLFTTLITISWCGAYKILVVFPLPSKSHSILGDAHVRLLLDAGHEITYITPFSMDDHPRLRQIKLGTDNYPAELNLQKMIKKEVDFNDQNIVRMLMIKVSAHALANKDIQQLINDTNEEFDLVIAQWLFTELFCGFAAVFDCPYIWSSSLDTHSSMLSLIDDPAHPAYTTGALSSNTVPFSYKQRIQELWNLLKNTAFIYFYASYYETLEYQKWYSPAVAKRGRSLPSYEDLKHNGSLILGNANACIGQATRLPQNYKAVGGFYINSTVHPLPQDIKTLLDNSKNGLIYFSLGSNIKSKDLPEQIIRSVLEMFGRLKHDVLWKFEGSLKNVPKNVYIVKWAPQQSVLSHSNCKLFVTHGGLLSTTEAIHFAKPIVGIPVFADQFANVDRLVLKGCGRRVSLGYELANELREAIEEVISNPRYAIKTKELSLVYHDSVVSPAKELVHWVEHVVRTRGAPHLRSPALMVPWYQKMYLDLLAQVILVIFVVKIIVKRILFSKT